MPGRLTADLIFCRKWMLKESLAGRADARRGRGGLCSATPAGSQSAQTWKEVQSSTPPLAKSPCLASSRRASLSPSIRQQRYDEEQQLCLQSSITMPRAIRGVLIECDPSIKSIIVNIDSDNHDFIIEDLDEERVVVKENMVPLLKQKLEDRLKENLPPVDESGSE
ncbi:DNA repair protein Rex1 [Purpureocillium lilacinum]|uniref:General transcription and DNA repair factor IIH subunit TFB5 n=8 Tax=Hypocreales TaxID=5125 RepID=A0A2U3ELM1_PURLI|nr:hypothetical protein Purlil1_9103 [Purpureocillium lilacinum]PWI75416.1 DNA repair protein Rex1 [Purpureocillium lilacinum]